MWMVMRGCSRSRITPAVFSHTRARADVQGVRWKRTRKHASASGMPDTRAVHVRERDGDSSLERDGTRDSVARSKS